MKKNEAREVGTEGRGRHFTQGGQCEPLWDPSSRDLKEERKEGFRIPGGLVHPMQKQMERC